jgi:hypothetical protein
MKEVDPSQLAQLSKAPQDGRRAALLLLLAGSIILGIGLIVAVQHSRR